MIEKIMNRPNILTLVDTQILPLVEVFRKEQESTLKKKIAQRLLEHEDIFEYHFPEDFAECQKLKG